MSIRDAVANVRREGTEFLEATWLWLRGKGSWDDVRDEGSDAAHTVNRLLGALVRRHYVRALPWADRCHAKMVARVEETGCTRSRRQQLAGNGCSQSRIAHR